MKNAFFIFLFFVFTGTFVSAGEILSLQESIDIGIKNNLLIKIDEARLRQVEMEKQEVYSYFFPRVSSSFTYTRLDEAQKMGFALPPELGIPPMSFEVTDANLYTLGFGLLQPLYTGGKIKSSYAKAEENIKRTIFEQNITAQDLVLEIKKGYFNILKAQKMLLAALSLKKTTEEHMRVAQASFNEGLVTRIDILKTEVFLVNTDKQILEAQNAIDLAKSAFSFLLNRPLSEDFEVKDILEEQKDTKALAYWTQLAYEQRPEIKRLESISKIYAHDINIEKSGLKPQISFFSNYELDRGSQGAIDEWQDSWNIGIAIGFDIWNKGETRYRVKKAENKKQEIDRQYELQVKSIELEIKNAYINLLFAQKEIETAKKTQEKAKENLRIANTLYKEGMATTTDVLDAQTDLTSAENDYYQALYNYQTAYGVLEKAAGKPINR